MISQGCHISQTELYAENKNFCYYSRGSAKETVTGIRKAKTRNLVSDENLFCSMKNLIFISD